MSWTDERIDQLKTMWERGLTASQIADELGGVSRNAVIGKAHRLGLQSRPSPVKANDAPRKAAAPARKPAPTAPVAATPAPAPVAEAPRAAAPTPPAAPVRAPAPVAQPAPPPVAAASGFDDAEAPTPKPRIISVGPGGFLRQGPGDQQAPIPPAPPRRLVPARPGAEVAGKTSLLDLNDKICKWPIGHPGEPDFHFCGQPVNAGFPYCIDHCGQAYQAQLPRRDRRAPPPISFGGPRAR